MRIISGIAKNRKINLPRGVKIRVTLDKVREALFSILGEYVKGKDVLDLFAGSGALGIEALSRGAKSVTFVDNNSSSIQAIEDNLNNLKFGDQAVVLNFASQEAIKELESKGKRFDLVLADPPYGMANIPLKNLAESDILKNCFVVVIEHYKKDVLPAEQAGLRQIKQSRYGDTVLSFYKKR